MKKYIFILLIFFSCKANLLQQPEALSAEQIDELAHNWNTQFTWEYWNVKGFALAECTFSYENQKSSFVIKLLKIPVYWHKCRLLPTIEEIKSYLTSPTYLFTAPLKVNNNTPQQASLEIVSNILKTKKVIFYTGAGISASNVATMNDLMRSLEMDRGKQHFLKTVLLSPKKLSQAFSIFCRSAINAEPTPAHYALTQIALRQSTAIITENVDLLHQRTGIKPIFAYSDFLRQTPKKELQSIDAIICVGLSHDDRGFLAWYKQYNPKGVLIAIDLKAPNYLSNSDFMLLGDIQIILPQLSSRLR